MNCCHGHEIKNCNDCSVECHMEIEDLRKELARAEKFYNAMKARAEAAEARIAKLEGALRRCHATLEEIASLADQTDAPGWALRTIGFEARTTLEKDNA